MKKENVIKALEMIRDCLQSLQNSLETWDKEEYDINKDEQAYIVNNIIMRIDMKIRLLDPNRERGFRTFDFFPDLEEKEGQIIQNKFFYTVSTKFLALLEQLKEEFKEHNSIKVKINGIESDEIYIIYKEDGKFVLIGNGIDFDKIYYESLGRLLSDNPDLKIIY